MALFVEILIGMIIDGAVGGLFELALDRALGRRPRYGLRTLAVALGALTGAALLLLVMELWMLIVLSLIAAPFVIILLERWAGSHHTPARRGE